MTTNQTIDGVPRLRELLERVVAHCIFWHDHAYLEAIQDIGPELRALLDAPAENVIDVSVVSWDEIQKAASESTWMPPEYMRNDWVDDVCRFLREGPAAQPQGDTVGVSARWSDWSMVTLEIDGQHRTYVEACKPKKPQGEQVAWMPVERCYDARAKMIIAFNEAKKAGGDLDDWLDAAYKSALRYSPNPLTAEQPAPVAVVLPPRKHVPDFTHHPLLNKEYMGWNSCIDEVTRLNAKSR